MSNSFNAIFVLTVQTQKSFALDLHPFGNFFIFFFFLKIFLKGHQISHLFNENTSCPLCLHDVVDICLSALKLFYSPLRGAVLIFKISLFPLQFGQHWLIKTAIIILFHCLGYGWLVWQWTHKPSWINESTPLGVCKFNSVPSTTWKKTGWNKRESSQPVQEMRMKD